MVTTTTSLVCARLVPSLMAPEPDPLENPPPCSHTNTGRFPPPRDGVQTFSTRQSSLCAGPLRPVCGAVGPYSSASRTPVHLAGLTGGMNRFAPDVLAPYGIPLKTLMSPATLPRILPEVVSATTLSLAPGSSAPKVT